MKGLLAGLLAFAVLGAGCAQPHGRIRADDESNLVGSTRAGTATYDLLIARATQELFDKTAIHSVNHADGPMLVAFGGVINKSSENLNDLKEAINQSLETVVTNAGLFTLINQMYVKAALREIQVTRVENLFLGKYRKRFLAELEAEGLVPHYLIMATITTQTTRASGFFRDTKERVYSLSLDMVDAKSGRTVAKVMKKVTKEYQQ